MKYRCLAALISMLPIFALAKDPTPLSPYYVKGGVNSSILDANKKESEAFGYEAMFGYTVDDHIFLEAGYQNFNIDRDDNLDLDALSIKANWLVPVSDYTSIYVGSGFSYINDSAAPTAQLGLQYKLSSHWGADVSYQGFFDIDEIKDDLYSFNLSLYYRFPSMQDNAVVKVDNAAPQKEIEKPVQPKTISLEEVCDMETFSYQLVEGDYLIKVAAENDTTLKDIVEKSPRLKGRDLNLVYPGETVNYSKEVCRKDNVIF
ncbi:porin family protein [Vibrio owensii]|uniref:porin family protein n=1 Tax=Vibrio owensii TaxID=696485 RepID=UPI003DA18E3E